MRIGFLFLLLFSFANASIEQHLIKIDPKSNASPIRGIDCIYLINLDERPEKLNQSMAQLKPYGILPHRVSAVNGWRLSPEALNDVGLRFEKGMEKEHWVKCFPADKKGEFEWEFLTDECVGKVCFAPWMSQGAIGCTLSHLSVLQDAYEAGYKAIWVMEDDIYVLGNPYRLSELIDRLDALVGDWDLLYTDFDIADKPMYPWENDFESDLKGHFYWLWRPDIPMSGKAAQFARRKILSEEFLEVGSRFRTHSMVLRRSGIKKILDHYRQRSLFIPYDNDLPFVKDLRMVSLRFPFVTHGFAPSDTRVKP